jgi:hypothetical protein
MVSETDSESDTAEGLVAALLKDVRLYEGWLSGEDVPNEGSFHPVLNKLLSGQNAKLSWNATPTSLREAILQNDANLSALQQRGQVAMIEQGTEIVKRLISSLRKTIKREVSNIAIYAPSAVFKLFFLYLELSKEVPTSSFTRKSLEALSNKSEVSAAQVVYPLTGDNIHYNMFISNDLREQNFNRFQFPDDFARDLPELYKDVTHDLDVMQQFLTRACSRAKEVETQAIFSLFVEKLLQVCNTEESLVGHARRFAVAAVTEMRPVSASVKIAESYMRENEALRASAQKIGTLGYTGGDWSTYISIMSDLVVYPFSTDQSGPTNVMQQRLFRNCDLNIEMKRFRLLVGGLNKQQLSQISAESYARKSLLSEPKILFSLLTDSCGFYALCHFVTSDGEYDKYWVSRSESDPKRAVAMIRWLLKRCRSSEELNLEGWRVETSSLAAQDNPAVGQSDKKRPSGGPPGPKDEGGGGKRHLSVTPKNVAGAALTMEDVWGNDSFGSSEDECDWDFFYTQQMQRQAGPVFEFSGGPLTAKKTPIM